jgi:hypothetical protein
LCGGVVCKQQQEPGEKQRGERAARRRRGHRRFLQA